MKKTFSLTEDELKAFRENGFHGPFDVYDPEEMTANYKQLRAEIFDRKHAIYDLEHTSLLAGYDRHLDIDFFSRHIMQRRILDKVESVLGPDLLCWRSEMFPKYPGDEGTDWHQADTFGHASGNPQVVWPDADFGGALTVWTAVTDSDLDNGCLRFIPGTHEEMFYDETKEMKYSPEQINQLEKNGQKQGFFGYDYRNLQKDPDWVPDDSKAVSMVMKPGQSVMFWSTLMHASYANTTKNRTRLGFTARYVPSSVRIYPGTDSIQEYGSTLSLDKYGVVVVSGEDKFRHNKVLTQNARGTAFAA
ncbi:MULTISPECIES: chlorinating enzyme [unclassified Massilia]|uniref:chlorinating enzyme n=1 Tax=unclassified Massilia TaxID=2609279 RepID=UPI001782FB64|nr:MULTISPECIES: chlorinating enzyme [unclassified Massilia]MBD8529977.1 chlorinating enzyme [Massilia sp. CFBP 13647]MBD8673895.1 chlorinating enzyme [Massilia sp. CFBP 13721]